MVKSSLIGAIAKVSQLRGRDGSGEQTLEAISASSVWAVAFLGAGLSYSKARFLQPRPSGSGFA
jgi:hypothetical protein